MPVLDLDTSNSATAPTSVDWTGSNGGAKDVFLVNDTGGDFTQASSHFNAALAGWGGGGTNGGTSQVGVYGYSNVTNGSGVAGRIGTGTGVLGQAVFAGAGVEADGQQTARGLIASSEGSQGVWSKITNSSNAHDSVRAETAGAGSGIYATSANGAGGKFAGKTANIQLVPSSASSHPASGSAGQLFVDHSNRLWYCKGGSSWSQLA